MRTVIIVTAIVGAIGAWFALRTRTQSPSTGQSTTANASGAGRNLRLLMLSTPPRDLGTVATPEFPRVYGILMDWPIGDQIATVFSTSAGTASLYTTSTFGIIGGEGHDSVRSAAREFVRGADRHYDEATPATAYPYPSVGRVRFYLLTFEGVRVIDTDLASATTADGKFAGFFASGQKVLTELRLATDKQEYDVRRGVM